MEAREVENQLDVPKNDYFYSEEKIIEIGFIKTYDSAAFAMFYREEDRCEIVFKKCGNMNNSALKCDSYLIINVNYKKELKIPEKEVIYSIEEFMEKGFVVEKICTVYTFFIRQQDGCRVVCKNPVVNEGYSVRHIEFF